MSQAQGQRAGDPGSVEGASRARENYLRLLAWAFTLFSSVRILAYLPMAWAILTSGSSQQHSLLTWAIWTSSNMTMAAWLYEDNGRRLNRAIVVNIGNALMCLVILALVAFYRH